MKKIEEKKFRHFQYVAAYSFWKTSMDNVSAMAEQATTFDRRQTRHFLLQCLSVRVENEQKKSFNSIGRKLNLETVAIYVLWDSGHIIKFA